MAPKMNKKGGSRLKSTNAGNAYNSGTRQVVTRSGPPRMRFEGEGTRIVNTEIVSGLGTLFTAGSVIGIRRPFNPCDTGSWGWLAQLALNYSQYKINKLNFTWVPSCPVSAFGELQLGVMYDFEDSVTYIDEYVGSTQLSNLGEFAYGAAYQGGALTQDFNKNSVGATWLGVNADVNRIHAARPRFLLHRSGGGDAAYENQIDACHFMIRTYTPGGSTQIATGQFLISYDLTFYHANIAVSNRNPTPPPPFSDSVLLDKFVGRTEWRYDPKTGQWIKVVEKPLEIAGATPEVECVLATCPEPEKS